MLLTVFVSGLIGYRCWALTYSDNRFITRFLPGGDGTVVWKLKIG